MSTKTHYTPDLDFAKEADHLDPLRSFRDQFIFPHKRGKKVIYFCGNSLGLQPQTARKAIEEELQNWAEKGVEGHFEGESAWVEYHKLSKEALGHLLGTSQSEVVCMNNLTTNLHLLLGSFYRPKERRRKLLIEKGAFPSDYFAVTTFMEILGQDPNDCLVEMEIPLDGYLEPQKITQMIEDLGDELALVLWPGVQYYTGQFFDLHGITRAAHEVGALAGFDLAHAIGNLPMNLHDDDVDFATWCSYKYLNSGPGNVSGIFVHEKHGTDPAIPRFGGWWGHNEATRFKMENRFDPMPGADGWQLSNMNILATAVHHASLAIFEEAGIQRLRSKSIQLTGYLEFLLNSHPIVSKRTKILTPSTAEERGCQLSIYLSENGKEIFNYLIENGVVLDWREPNVIRVAPAPLYNGFEEVYNFVEILGKGLDQYS